MIGGPTAGPAPPRVESGGGAYPAVGAWVGLASCAGVASLCLFAWLFSAAELVWSGYLAWTGNFTLAVVTVLSLVGTWLIWRYIGAHEPQFQQRHRNALNVGIVLAAIICGLGIYYGIQAGQSMLGEHEATRQFWWQLLFGK